MPGDYLGNMTESQKRLKRIMKDAQRIQDRFAAEPVLARTGKGFLKSEGVETLQRIKAGLGHQVLLTESRELASEDSDYN